MSSIKNIQIKQWKCLIFQNLLILMQYKQLDREQKQKTMEQPQSKNNSEKRKIKLIKDLKYGKVHLRQSLLELSEFQDLTKLFKQKKDNYSIHDQDITLPTEKTEQNQEDTQVLLSPFERIQIYRKEKLNKKMKEKMNKMLGREEIIKTRPRMPKTTKLLESFQQKYKKEMPISYKQDLRQSEINLERIKMNNKRKFQVSHHSVKPLYQSRLQSNKVETANSFITTPDSPNTSQRKRFMSLKTSLPDREKHVYPSIRQIIQGKSKEDHHGPVINFKNIDSLFDSFLHNNIKKIKSKNENQERRYSSLNRQISNSKPQTAYMQTRKQKINVERCFTRSEESSKQVINTMASFYQTKHSKKHNYDEMVQNLKYDRPLTSELRRKNYTVLGKETLEPIKEYREVSQIERKRIRQASIQFYSNLIEGLEAYHEHDIPTTIFIVEEVRKIFESEYIFTESILKDLLNTVSKMEMDSKTEDILHKIGEYVGFKIQVTMPQE